MIDDMLKLSVDQLYSDFQGVNEEPSSKPVNPVKGYTDEENMWELIVNLKDKKSRKEAKQIYLQPLEMNSKFAF